MGVPSRSDLSAILLPFISGLVGGMCFALPFNWGLRRFLVELEYRVSDQEGRVNREVKKRAQEASIEKRKENTDLDDWAREHKSGSTSLVPSGHKFNDWWNHVKTPES